MITSKGDTMKIFYGKHEKLLSQKSLSPANGIWYLLTLSHCPVN